MSMPSTRMALLHLVELFEEMKQEVFQPRLPPIATVSPPGQKRDSSQNLLLSS
jgi:hypothetical protein